MNEKQSSHHGTFELYGAEVWGELRFAEKDTQLTLRTEKKIENPKLPAVIHGRLHDGKSVTCVECVGPDFPELALQIGGTNAAWRAFPHFVLMGRSHFSPDADRVEKVWFAVGDIHQIFNDFDSFGIFGDAEVKKQIKELIPHKIGDRDTPIGDEPVFVYFAGRRRLLKTDLPFGTFELLVLPTPSGDTEGAFIRNQMKIQIEFAPALQFDECISKIMSIGQFLSLVAGRSQGLQNIQMVMESAADHTSPLSLYWPLGPVQYDGQEMDTPSWRDIPLDGIRRPDEFSRVLKSWFASEEHRIARSRLYSCRDEGNRYTSDRLVAAANLFEHTKTGAIAAISDELEQAIENCKILLEGTPKCDDRTSAIQGLGRVGKPTMMKKVLARAECLHGHFQLPRLNEVIRQAVLCRNFFVHGSDDSRFIYEAVEPYTSFLTDTLEFVFAAAELIESGWQASVWRQRPHTGYHWFSRYVAEYIEESHNLFSSIEMAKKAKRV